ncbi:hypothetical protein [Halomonas llamarensis]|uniref:BRCT domain-containing protein n=1 Tax=Halomonas llamarensis TaxID=2945104 RepID=A0ABT0SRT5_9GAMM|nr:hypothetical protein [Halomonas llamarensis]MCL7930451.1 hypothetical protein [Halomonas llamarensis]
MDSIALVVGFILGVGTWVGIAHSMKRNSRPWWWRHLSGATLLPLAVVGGSMLVASLGGVTDQEGAPLGMGGAFAGLAVLLPVIIVLGISWRTAKRQAPMVSKPEAPQEDQPEPKPKPILKRSATEPGNLLFVYENAEGEQSTRELRSWSDSGRYIKGYCLTSGAIRTFRRDRVLEFLDGEALLGAVSAPAATKASAPERPLEILFTGFDANARQELEDEAKNEGMVVRKSLTKNLDFLCTGPNAGPRKVSEARGKGVEVMDEPAFLEFLETGVLPN